LDHRRVCGRRIQARNEAHNPPIQNAQAWHRATLVVLPTCRLVREPRHSRVTKSSTIVSFMDEDLNQMTREELIAEVKKLRQGVRQHRDSSLHELCWHHPSLWGLLPERTDPIPVIPEWPEFIRGCVRYRQSLDEQAANAPRTNEPYERRSALTSSTTRI
jgi:hypothetical protein